MFGLLIVIMDRYICKEVLKYVKGELGVCFFFDLKSFDF